MDIDFSVLDAIGSPQKGNNASGIKGDTKPLETDKKPTEERVDTLQRKANDRKKQLEDSASVLRDFQVNKRLTTNLVADITKGLQAGNDIYDLFLLAVEAVGLTTNDTELLRRSRETIKAVYGIGLGEQRPLEIAREDISTRLDRLETSLANASDKEAKERLKRAVEAHRAKLEELD